MPGSLRAARNRLPLADFYFFRVIAIMYARRRRFARSRMERGYGGGFMIRENTTKSKLRRGDTVFGMISLSADPLLAEWCGLVGFDFYMLDAEHGAITLAQAENVVRACEGAHITPLIRPGIFDPKLVMQYLDLGMLGVMQPGLKNADEVQTLVNAVRYPPRGTRALGPARANDFFIGQMAQAEFVAFANDQMLALPQFEEPEMYDELNAIVQIEGVDGICIGPRDLALAMGYPDGAHHRPVQALIKEAIALARGANLAVGMPAATGGLAQRQIKQGANFIMVSTHSLMQQGAKNFLNG
ncbi:host specificity protein [Anaerolineae bacterium CFX7]|nr:host specificity protein [Anaerolineae bacterium CFX7]